jgi:hypothetical protein
VIAERLADDLVFSWKFRKRTENKKQKTERDEFASPVRTRKSEAHFEFAPYLLSKPDETRGVMTRRSSDAPWFSCFVSARRVNRSFNHARARESSVWSFSKGETVGLIARSLVFNRRSERRAGFSTGHAR